MQREKQNVNDDPARKIKTLTKNVNGQTES
jgi:hypothetical protein